MGLKANNRHFILKKHFEKRFGIHNYLPDLKIFENDSEASFHIHPHLLKMSTSSTKITPISIHSLGVIRLTLSMNFDISCYFSILILASTATTLSLRPSKGFKSISNISGAASTKAETLETISAKSCSFTGSCPRTPWRIL